MHVTVHVYFLINTCPTGLRSSKVISIVLASPVISEVLRRYHHRPRGQGRGERGIEKGGGEEITCGAAGPVPRESLEVRTRVRGAVRGYLSLDVAMRMVNLAPTPCDAQVLEESCARKSRMQA